MGKLRRTAMIVFVVAAVLGVGVLAALWFAWTPLFPLIAWLVSMDWFFLAEAILLGITAIGLLATFIRAITAPGRKSRLVVERDNGSIAITQNAIQSTVKHVVETHRGLTSDGVRVHISGGHRPHLAVYAKIDPGRNAELNQLGAKLQNEIAATLEAFTGHPADSVCITFTGDADVVTPAFTQQATKYAQEASNARSTREAQEARALRDAAYRQQKTQPMPASAAH